MDRQEINAISYGNLRKNVHFLSHKIMSIAGLKRYGNRLKPQSQEFDNLQGDKGKRVPQKIHTHRLVKFSGTYLQVV